MIDEKTLQRYLKRNVKKLQKAMGLETWYVVYKWAAEFPDSPDSAARVFPDYNYNSAEIEFNLSHIESERHLFVYLRHELTHLLAASYFLALETAEDMLPEGSKAALKRLSKYADEQFVLQMEKLLERNGITYDKFN